MMGLAANLALELPVRAVGWAPAQTWMEPRYFCRSVLNWLGGGAFPALGLTALLQAEDGSLASRGLAHFTGQEVQLEGRRGEAAADTVKLAVRVIDQLVRRGASWNPCGSTPVGRRCCWSRRRWVSSCWCGVRTRAERTQGYLSFRAVNRSDAPGYDPGLQRHHLLPRQLLGQSAFMRMLESIGGHRHRFEDFRENGLLLPCDGKRRCAWGCRYIAGRIGSTASLSSSGWGRSRAAGRQCATRIHKAPPYRRICGLTCCSAPCDAICWTGNGGG
ncbi:hypothetical protein ACFSLT_16960 [Novosphingobium resinovorum]